MREMRQGFLRPMTGSVAQKATGSDQVVYGDHTISMTSPFRRLSLREAARAAAAQRLNSDVPESALRSKESAAELARRLGVEVDPAAGPGKITAITTVAIRTTLELQP